MQSRPLRTIAALAALLLAWLGWSLLGPTPRGPAVAPRESARAPALDSGLALGREPAAPASPDASSAVDEPRTAVMDPSAGPRAELAGRVEGLELPHAYGEVRVALWAEGVQPDCGLLATADARSTPLRVVSVAPDGSFLFEDLPADGSYHLRGGGAAHISQALERPVTVADVPVLLQLARVKGLEIELVGRDGKAPRTHPSLVLEGSSFGGSALMNPGALLDTWEEQLAAVPGAGCEAEQPGLASRFVLSGPAEFSALGPIACDLRVPGYRPQSRMLWADPVRERIPRVRIELESTAAGWGSFELELTGLCEAAAGALRPETELGSLTMVYADEGQLHLPIRGGAGVRRFDGIPVGSVRATFRSRGGYRWPPEGETELRVGELPERMRVDLSGSGALKVLWTPAPGEASPLASQFVLQLPDRRGALPVRVAELPLLLPIAAPGQWQLAGYSRRAPTPAQPRTSRETLQYMARTQVTVQAGALAELVLADD